jgi:glycosyltransferase involved in cell wall biosynthesis
MKLRMLFNLKRFFWTVFETVYYIFSNGSVKNKFYVVSCQRNAGNAAVRCLDSIYNQKYENGYLNHIFVDDASDDNTVDLVLKWSNSCPENRVKFVFRKKRIGETANNVWAIRQVPRDAIVLIVDGDDWLPNNSVIEFLNKVYASENVWMTYNSFRIDKACVADMSIPYPSIVVYKNSFRSYEWRCGAPRSFRKMLFDHVNIRTLVDPDTGRFFDNSYDMALFLSMLELSGKNAKHLYKVNYVYNVRECSHVVFEPNSIVQTAKKIRKSNIYEKIHNL